jgi:hypothetical protein
MRSITVVLELSEDEAGTYVVKATRDDGQVALVESTESLFEASAYALGQVTADIMPVR